MQIFVNRYSILQFSDLAQVDIPQNVADNLEGESLKNIIEGQKPERDALFWHYPHYHIEGAKPYSAIRKSNYKLTHHIEDNRYELFDLKADIGEQNDISEQLPEKVKELTEQLENWKTKVGAQMPTENPNYDPERWNKKK